MTIRITLLFVLMLQVASAPAQEDALAEQAAITETQSSDDAKANAETSRARQRTLELAAEQRKRLDLFIAKVQRKSDELAEIQSLDYGGGASATLNWDTQREEKCLLDAEGITIPFPQRDIHHHPAKDAKSSA